MNKLDFTCSFSDRNVDRVLYDRIHQSISRCESTSVCWTYYPTVKECNEVLRQCVIRLDELNELDTSIFDLDDKLEMERMTRVVMSIFVNIQQRLLEV